MDDNVEECMTIFSQDGVLLKRAHIYINYINCTGMLSITQYLNSNKSRCIEWKHPNDVTIDSDIQDPESAVVSTVERSSSIGSNTSDSKSKHMKVDVKDIKSFKVSKQNDGLSFYDRKGDVICQFFFQHGNCSTLVAVLEGLLKTCVGKSRNKLIHHSGRET